MTFLRRHRDAVAVAAGLLVGALVLFADLPEQWLFLIAFAFAAVMVGWIAVQDLSTLTIPDGPILAMAMSGFAQRLKGAGTDIWSELISCVIAALVCGGVLLLLRETYFRLRGQEGLGFGDVKLATAAGAVIGTVGFAWAVLMASLAGLVIVLVASQMKPQRDFDRIAFGALLAPAVWLIWIFNVCLTR